MGCFSLDIEWICVVFAKQNSSGTPRSPWDWLRRVQVLLVHWGILPAMVPFKVFSLVFYCLSQYSELFCFIPFLTLSPLHITYPKEFSWAFSLPDNDKNSVQSQILNTFIPTVSTIIANPHPGTAHILSLGSSAAKPHHSHARHCHSLTTTLKLKW